MLGKTELQSIYICMCQTSACLNIQIYESLAPIIINYKLSRAHRAKQLTNHVNLAIDQLTALISSSVISSKPSRN